ncbi:alpha/beta fold hydrolase [Mycolicibacterium sp. A43C]
MHASAPVLDYRSGAAPIGYRHFHADVSLNFQCNRWLQWIGAEAFDEISVVARSATSYPEWITGFLGLAESARRDGRMVAAAYYDRAAEFFMVPTDPRRAPARARFLSGIRKIYGVTPDLVPYRQKATLPVYDLQPTNRTDSVVVVFGGFDSYIEEFLPLLAAIVGAGHRVVAFDGPGQGGALEDAGLPMTERWEEPVTAVLDHYGLDDVTAVGVSLGGGLVIRAAAFEPRISRVVALDILDDELDVVARQIGPGLGPGLRLLLALRAAPVLDALARLSATLRPVAAWGLQQGMHITGTATPYEFLRATRSVHTRAISDRVTADVLLLAGADDHYVPLRQLRRQAANLRNARSVTTRLFTAADQAGNHCQIGNIGICVRTITTWLETVRS